MDDTTSSNHSNGTTITAGGVGGVGGEKLIKIVAEIRDNLQQQQQKDGDDETVTANLNLLKHTLHEDFKPFEVMEYLASRLFFVVEEENNDAALLLNGRDAFMVLYFLVSSEGIVYLKEAYRAVKAEAIRLSSPGAITNRQQKIVVSTELLQVMVAQISGNDVALASDATETIVACCKMLGGIQSTTCQEAVRFVSGSLQRVWELLVSGDTKIMSRSEASTICIRCISAIVDLITELDKDSNNNNNSDGAAASSSGVMEFVISNTDTMDIMIRIMTDGSDPLLQMSVLDLVEQLATAFPMDDARAKWLFSDQILYPLLQMAGGGGASEEDDDQNATADPILGGSALRLLSSLCKVGHHYPEELFRESNNRSSSSSSSSSMFTPQQLLTSFHRALHNFDAATGNESDRLAIIDAISSFASTSNDALQLVLDDPVTRQAWLSIDVAQPKLKSAILTSVALVMDPPPPLQQQQQTPTTTSNDDTTTTITVSMLLKLYGFIGRTNHNDSTTGLLLTLAKSTILEDRLGAYVVMKAVANLPSASGAQVLLQHQEFYPFLVGGSSSSGGDAATAETTKVGREAKFAILHAIWNSPVKGLLAQDIVRQLDKLHQQGPHYVQAQRYDVDTVE